MTDGRAVEWLHEVVHATLAKAACNTVGLPEARLAP